MCCCYLIVVLFFVHRYIVPPLVLFVKHKHPYFDVDLVIFIRRVYTSTAQTILHMPVLCCNCVFLHFMLRFFSRVERVISSNWPNAHKISLSLISLCASVFGKFIVNSLHSFLFKSFGVGVSAAKYVHCILLHFNSHLSTGS